MRKDQAQQQRQQTDKQQKLTNTTPTYRCDYAQPALYRRKQYSLFSGASPSLKTTYGTTCSQPMPTPIPQQASMPDRRANLEKKQGKKKTET